MNAPELLGVSLLHVLGMWASCCVPTSSVLSECVCPSGMIFRTKGNAFKGHTGQEVCSRYEKQEQEGTWAVCSP